MSADVIKIIIEKCPTAEATMKQQSYTVSCQYPMVLRKSSQPVLHPCYWSAFYFKTTISILKRIYSSSWKQILMMSLWLSSAYEHTVQYVLVAILALRLWFTLLLVQLSEWVALALFMTRHDNVLLPRDQLLIVIGRDGVGWGKWQ